jgi:hypothetical protein
MEFNQGIPKCVCKWYAIYRQLCEASNSETASSPEQCRMRNLLDSLVRKRQGVKLGGGTMT